MANLTVAEKTHWKERIEARINRRIEAILAAEPGLMGRVLRQAKARALASPRRRRRWRSATGAPGGPCSPGCAGSMSRT
jgi:hypothetical protein